MKTLFSWCIAMGLVVVATTASALPGTFVIEQIYSNADATVQFVVIFDRGHSDCDSGENVWAGQTLISTGPGPQKTFAFPTDLPTCETSQRRILIATSGFAASASFRRITSSRTVSCKYPTALSSSLV